MWNFPLYSLSQSADAVQLALKLDGRKLEGRRIRVRRSLKESENKGAKGRSGKGPAPKRERHQGRVGSPNKFSHQQRTSKIYTSFSGIKVDPNVKTKKNHAKKKVKHVKSVHIWLPCCPPFVFTNFIPELWVGFNGCHVMLHVVLHSQVTDMNIFSWLSNNRKTAQGSIKQPIKFQHLIVGGSFD